jgi:hypothetical protein
MSELSRETSSLVERGRHGESLGAAEKARLKRAVLAQVAVASVVGTSSTAAAWTTVAAKVAAVVVVVSSVAGGTVALVSSRTQDTAGSTRAAAPSARPLPVKAPSVSAPIAPPIAATSSPDTPAAPPIVLDRPPPPTRPVSHETISPGQPAAAPPTSLEQETRLLRDADDALKSGDPERALRLLADLASRFPDSALASERSAERVFALCMAGRKDEARDAARVFLSNESTGPLAARVRASCGGSAP